MGRGRMTLHELWEAVLLSGVRVRPRGRVYTVLAVQRVGAAEADREAAYANAHSPGPPVGQLRP